MKKTLILISIFMIRLISCSGKKSAVNVAANKTVGLPNPVQESTAEEMKKFFGTEIGYSYRRIQLQRL